MRVNEKQNVRERKTVHNMLNMVTSVAEKVVNSPTATYADGPPTAPLVAPVAEGCDPLRELDPEAPELAGRLVPVAEEAAADVEKVGRAAAAENNWVDWYVWQLEEGGMEVV